MANDAVSETVTVKRRGKKPKEERLFRKRSSSMILIVEKKQDSGEPFKYRDAHANRAVIRGQVECDETRKPYKRVKRKREAGSDCERSTAMERANTVQESLGTKLPSFVKNMLPSHVTGGYWLGLPTEFCRLHLPKEDTTIILEDSDKKDFETKYLFGKGGLSAGWRGYAIKHNLVEGDVLVFHLVTPTKFKIYTLKADGSDEVNGVHDLPKSDEHAKEMDSTEIGNAITQESTQNDVPTEESEIEPEDHENNVPTEEPEIEAEDHENDAPTEEPEIEAEDHENDTLGGIRLVETLIPFRKVRTIADFNIVVNGLIIDSEFSEEVMRKYYDLCRGEGAYLHECLLEGICYKLAMAAIKTVTTVADGVAEASGKQLAIWDKVLEGFEVMGMNVKFLRDQIGELIRVRDGGGARKNKEEGLRNVEVF